MTDDPFPGCEVTRSASLGLLFLLPALASFDPPADEVSGRLVSADAGPVAGMRVFLRQGARMDSAEVEADGRFSVRGAPGGEPLELAVDAPDRAARRYHPAVARLEAADLAGDLVVVMVPRSWVVRTGRHAGARVEISLERAFAPACPGCSSFFRAGLRDPSSGRIAPTPTWPAGAFPLRMAFGGEPPSPPVAPRDSTAFWRIAEELEADFGRDLLRPARYRETLPDERGAPEDVVLVESDPRLRRVGWGSTISQAGDIVYGAIRIRDARVFSERDGRRLVKHELMHALGVGHTCAWRSVMAQIPECASRASSSPTPEDVAYFEVLSRTRALQRAFGARLALEAAHRGEATRARGDAGGGVDTHAPGGNLIISIPTPSSAPLEPRFRRRGRTPARRRRAPLAALHIPATL